MLDLSTKLSEGLSYQDFLARHGTDEQRRRWAAIHASVQLTAPQRELLASFKREMPVLCLAGAWCGDCVNQCPIFDHFAGATDRIKLYFFDRDTHPDVAADLKICGGARVPVLVFFSEDGFEVCRYGDRTLAKYRQIAAEATGAACSSGIADKLLPTVTQEWLDIFERVQWILRTSGRLREKHKD